MRLDRDQWEEIITTITRNKTRSILTAFGVFWGIFMLVSLMGGGQGLQDQMSANFKGFATNSGFVWPQQTSEPYKGFRKGRWWSLNNTDVERVRLMVPELETVTPVISRWGKTAIMNEYKSECIVKGLYPDYTNIEEQSIQYGRFINNIDVREHRKVCVIGKRVYEELFPKGENPCGKFVRVDGIYYQIVGVNFGSSNMQINGSAEESITLPFTVMQQAYNCGQNIDLLCFTAHKGFHISELQPKIEQIVKQIHLIHPEDKQAVMLLNTEAMFSVIDSLFEGIRTLVWLVGLGTLLAGIIGVSNIMMVTVRERTSEIGIRRAIGAKPIDILGQILAESMVLTSLAGMAGITLGVLVLSGMENIANHDGGNANFQISFIMAIGALILLILLGLVAGMAPAYRAMAIKPIDAIRDE